MVTIVVLLILAGITLTIVLGENGIINQAKKASEAQKIAEYKDIFELAKMTVYAKNHGNSVPLDQFWTELETQGIDTSKKTENNGVWTIILEDGITIKVTPIEDGKNIEIEYPDGTGNIGGGSTIAPPEEQETPKVADLVAKAPDYTKTTNTYAEDAYGNKIVIPAGMVIVPNSGNTKPADKTDTQWNAEKVVYSYTGNGVPSVQDGIVVQDKQGNQFVWVPVGTIKNKAGDTRGTTTTITLGRYENFTKTNGVYTPKQTVAQYKKAEGATQTDLQYQDTYKIDSYFMELTEEQEGKNKIADDLGSFLKNAKANGGYYIARYEASYGSGYDSTKSTEEEKFVNAKPLSKPSTAFRTQSDGSMNYVEGTLWNWITQANASKVSKNMYQSGVVKSDLVNSYAWDTAIIFIQTYAEGKESYATQDGKSINSNLTNTGVNNDIVCNIHDMASNTREWSTEHSSYTAGSDICPCVHVGGFYYDNFNTTSFRFYDFVSSTYTIAFRPLLNCSPKP